MAAGIHLAQEFRFYNIESNDLFLYDWSHVWTAIKGTGGLATLLASFLTQFMRVPFAGTVILTGVYLLVAFLLYKILCGKSDKMAMAGFSLLPVAFLFLCMENDYYRFQGHMAFVLMLTALYSYVSIPKEKVRSIVGLLLIPVLYHAAGSVTLVFAVSATLWEIAGNGLKGLKYLAYPVLTAATAFICVKASLVSSWEHALTPFMYYDWPSTYFFPVYAWTTVPALIILSWMISKLDVKPSGLSLQSTVYSALDYHAAARQAAFDANMVTSGNCNPRQIAVLARTNAALGACDVAEKYVRILEKTLFYRDDAKNLRNSFGQQEAILPETDEYVRYDGIKGDMRDILEVDPDHPVLSQFYQLYAILEKEVRK